jgi:hypothetical protein
VFTIDPNTASSLTALGVLATAICGLAAVIYGYLNNKLAEKNHTLAGTIQINTDGRFSEMLSELKILREANAKALILGAATIAHLTTTPNASQTGTAINTEIKGTVDPVGVLEAKSVGKVT